MLRRKRTCPGTSMNEIPAPDASVVCAKPRSIVRPRRFSSANRSGSVPVSASTSELLPWSTCPAVATTCIGRVLQTAQCRGDQVIVGGVDGAQVEHSHVVAHATDDRR